MKINFKIKSKIQFPSNGFVHFSIINPLPLRQCGQNEAFITSGSRHKCSNQKTHYTDECREFIFCERMVLSIAEKLILFIQQEISCLIKGTLLPQSGWRFLVFQDIQILHLSLVPFNIEDLTRPISLWIFPDMFNYCQVLSRIFERHKTRS